MGRAIVKQSNGKYAIFSSIVDDFIYCDLTKEEYIEIQAQEAYKSSKENMIRVFAEIEEKGFHSSYMKTYEECIRTIKMVHGEYYIIEQGYKNGNN